MPAPRTLTWVPIHHQLFSMCGYFVLTKVHGTRLWEVMHREGGRWSVIATARSMKDAKAIAEARLQAPPPES
jgi:hypothetical protein